jgi:hypothetical protein
MLTKILARSAAILALALAAPACGGWRVGLHAAPAELGVVQVRVVDAYTYGARVTVKAVVTNASSKPLTVDREGFDLRVGGKLLPHRSGLKLSHKPALVAPGEKQDVEVEFAADHDLGDLAKAALVVGGISAPAGAPAKVVGEVILVATGGDSRL